MIRFIDIRSSEAIGLLEHNLATIPDNTLILFYKDKIFVRSDAVLKIFSLIGFPYNLFVIFRFLPRRFRDNIYSIVASNRHRWFRNHTSCSLTGKT